MAKNNSCVHCGADCGKQPITLDENIFCCNGCKQVYLLLQKNNLQCYYTFNQNPGIKSDAVIHSSKYEFLEKQEIKDKMYEFYEGNIAKVTFYIPVIHCASCIWLLEHLYKLHTGIKSTSIQFVKKELSVSFNDSEISLRQLVELLVSLHYIPDLSLERFTNKHEVKTDKVLLYKIGVAGFVFGNVMLYSLPEYFNGEKIEGSLGTFLYYLCYVLTVPLVFYSGSDYIISAWKKIWKGIVNLDLPIAIGILALFFVTSYQIFTNTGPGYSDSLSGFLFFLLLGKWYQSKTYEALSFDRDYKSYFPVAVSKIVDGKEESILIENIVIGDELLLRNKELIPADSILLEGNAIIDYSFVTGESTPIQKNQYETLHAGGIQTSGAIKVKVIKTVTQSYLTQLWNSAINKEETGISMKTIIDKMGVRFTILVLLVSVISFFVWINIGSLSDALMVVTSVLIVACPCALALSLPFTFGNSMRILGKFGMYVKNVDVIEKLTKVTAIVFDKTGTITIPNEHEVIYIGAEIESNILQAIVSVANQSTHPLSIALVKKYNDIQIIPVTHFIEEQGKGVSGNSNEYAVTLGSAEYTQALDYNENKKTTRIYVQVNNAFLGYFEMHTKYREGFAEVISQLNTFKTYVSSGDNDAEKENLEKYILPNHMYFNQKPDEKMKFISKLKDHGEYVVMTGDGLNDAGAFRQANVGISIADDIYHFSPAGDAIVEAKSFHKLAKYIAFCKTSKKIVQLSFVFSITYNCIGLAFAVTNNMSPVVAAILMPISSVSVVAFTTFATRIIGRKILR